ncbi:hypothetical protein L6452_06229 [Arctium lappa]|uniref:Uncharacterized protein n=1 Tax=Arctium lappa TaxID=4217 RepID=A0ACB9EJ18_ARCLA|nr:hypothetical protein L6452_06229 [Arctium lappa]
MAQIPVSWDEERGLGAIEGDSPAILSAYLLNLQVSLQSSMGVEEEKKPDESHEIGGKNKWKLVCAQVARRCGVNVNAKSFRMYR